MLHPESMSCRQSEYLNVIRIVDIGFQLKGPLEVNSPPSSAAYKLSRQILQLKPFSSLPRSIQQLFFFFSFSIWPTGRISHLLFFLMLEASYEYFFKTRHDRIIGEESRGTLGPCSNVSPLCFRGAVQIEKQEG